MKSLIFVAEKSKTFSPHFILQKNFESQIKNQQQDGRVQQQLTKNETESKASVKDKNAVFIRGVTFYKADEDSYKEEEDEDQKKGRGKNGKCNGRSAPLSFSQSSHVICSLSFSILNPEGRRGFAENWQAANCYQKSWTVTSSEAKPRGPEQHFTNSSAKSFLNNQQANNKVNSCNHQSDWANQPYNSTTNETQASNQERRFSLHHTCHPTHHRYQYPSTRWSKPHHATTKTQKPPQLDGEPRWPTKGHKKAR